MKQCAGFSNGDVDAAYKHDEMSSLTTSAGTLSSAYIGRISRVRILGPGKVGELLFSFVGDTIQGAKKSR